MIVGGATIASNLNGEQQRIALRDSILTHITGGKKPEAIANIQSFGAKGDGTTDCFPAFKKAMQRAREEVCTLSYHKEFITYVGLSPL